MKDTTTSVPQEILSRVQDRMAALAASLLAADAEMPTHLAAIHKETQSYPELLTLMTDEEIKTIVGGLIRHTQTEIVKKKVASKTTVSKARVASMSTDDLI